MAHDVVAVLVREREALPPYELEAVDEQEGTVARLDTASGHLARQPGDHDGHPRLLDGGQHAAERVLRPQAERGPRLACALGPEVAVVAGHGRER